MVSTYHSDAGVAPTPAEMDQVADVFVKAGGSWEGCFDGAVKDVLLLKKVLRVAVKNDHFTKKPVWGS